MKGVNCEHSDPFILLKLKSMPDSDFDIYKQYGTCMGWSCKQRLLSMHG